MSKEIILIALFSLLTNIAVCQDIQTDPKLEIELNGKTYVQEVAPTVECPLNKNIIFVLDCSGSMEPRHMVNALNFIIGITSQPIDSLQIAVIAFNDSVDGRVGVYRWPGIPEPNLPVPVLPGWAALPSDQVEVDIKLWVTQLKMEMPDAGTEIIPAITQAILEDRDDLSIIIVSDGYFTSESDDNIVAAIGAALALREQKELKPLSIMSFDVNSGNARPIFARIAEIGHGGYYKEKIKDKQ